MYVSLVYLSTNMLVLGTNQVFTLLYISIALPHSKHCSTKLLLKVGSYMLHMSLCSMHEPHPLTEVLCYSGSNAEIILKYVHRNSIYTWPYHVCTKITKGQYSHPLTFDNMHNVFAPYVTTHPGQTTLDWPELPRRGTRWQRYHKNQCP